MDTVLAELFESGADHRLTGELFSRILAAHGNEVDAAKLSEEEQVVYLVIGAHGVIGNGGFRYLFEHNLNGDPYFALTLRAFEVIGCWEAAEAVRTTLAKFLNSKPPTNLEKRMRLYNRRIEEFPTPEDRQFFRAMDEIERRLADFVRARQWAFNHLRPG